MDPCGGVRLRPGSGGTSLQWKLLANSNVWHQKYTKRPGCLFLLLPHSTSQFPDREDGWCCFCPVFLAAPTLPSAHPVGPQRRLSLSWGLLGARLCAQGSIRLPQSAQQSLRMGEPSSPTLQRGWEPTPHCP